MKFRTKEGRIFEVRPQIKDNQYIAIREFVGGAFRALTPPVLISKEGGSLLPETAPRIGSVNVTIQAPVTVYGEMIVAEPGKPAEEFLK